MLAQLRGLPQEACSPPGRLSRICPGHQDWKLKEVRGGNSLRKTFVCERFQVRSHPLPDALVSASRSHTWGWFWPSRAKPGVLVPRWLKGKVFVVFGLTCRDTVWVQSSEPGLSGAGSFFEGE